MFNFQIGYFCKEGLKKMQSKEEAAWASQPQEFFFHFSLLPRSLVETWFQTTIRPCFCGCKLPVLSELSSTFILIQIPSEEFTLIFNKKIFVLGVLKQGLCSHIKGKGVLLHQISKKGKIIRSGCIILLCGRIYHILVIIFCCISPQTHTQIWPDSKTKKYSLALASL